MNIEPVASTEKIIYFVRHGQSEANAAPLFQGTDSPLSEEGIRQAGIIADRAASLSFETLIASPLERAKQTAEVISRKTGKPIILSDLFVERKKPSALNGKPFADEQAGILWREWGKSMHTPGIRFADAENYDDIITRTDQALAYLYERDEQSMVVVTHGYFLRAITARVALGESLTPAGFKNFHQSIDAMANTGLTVMLYEGAFEQEPRWLLRIYNDHTHLAK